MDHGARCFRDAMARHRLAVDALNGLQSPIADDALDDAMGNVLSSLEIMVRTPATTLRDLAAKVEAIIQNGDWPRHAALVLADLRGMMR